MKGAGLVLQWGLSRRPRALLLRGPPVLSGVRWGSVGGGVGAGGGLGDVQAAVVDTAVVVAADQHQIR